MRTEKRGARPVGDFVPCVRMCLACAFDLMSPSVHSWHQKDLTGELMRKSWKDWGQLSKLVLRPAQRPHMPQAISHFMWYLIACNELKQPANLRLHPYCVTFKRTQKLSAAFQEEYGCLLPDYRQFLERGSLQGMRYHV
jgi:hypothetical protein